MAICQRRARPTDYVRETGSTGTIRRVQKATANKRGDLKPRPGTSIDESRLQMMRREKAMTVEERLALFERLMRRVAWARSAKRLR